MRSSSARISPCTLASTRRNAAGNSVADSSSAGTACPRRLRTGRQIQAMLLQQNPQGIDARRARRYPLLADPVQTDQSLLLRPLDRHGEDPHHARRVHQRLAGCGRTATL